jgi:hypothetical protein
VNHPTAYGWGTRLNHVEALLARLKVSSGILTVGLILILLFSLFSFVSSVNFFLVLSILMCTLASVRFLHGGAADIRISTMRGNGKSIVFSDEGRRRFVAFSAIEMRSTRPLFPPAYKSDLDRSRVLKASRVIAEHIGRYSIEIKSRTSSVRYLLSSEAKTASDACHAAEDMAERMLRVIRELYHEDAGPEMIEGERLKNAFLEITGGAFESLHSVGNLLVRNQEDSVAKYGFAALAVTDPSFAKIDFEKLLSITSNLDAPVTYVINIQAHRTYNENVLIDGAEYGRTWLVSPYFIVSGNEFNAIQETSTKLRNDVEDATRARVIKILRASSIVGELGHILLRSQLNKKLFLTNQQLITHMFGAALS